jgi:hypothetical protein
MPLAGGLRRLVLDGGAYTKSQAAAEGWSVVFR